MPTYQYECSNPGCSHSFEYFQGINSRRKRKCPECGDPKLVRLISPGAGIIFKGPGFHCNDYKKKEEK